MAWLCDHQIKIFMQICEEIKLPVNLDKTHWNTTRIVFLGLLIDTVRQMIFLPQEKIVKGHQMVQEILEKSSKKITIKDLQKLTGFLNFLSRAIIPGRAFTRRLYAHGIKKNGEPLLQHHHIKVNQEMHLDLEIWKIFLHHESVFSRPFIDMNSTSHLSHKVFMYSDASRNFSLGVTAICDSSWCWQQWDKVFMDAAEPSIDVLGTLWRHHWNSPMDQQI